MDEEEAIGETSGVSGIPLATGAVLVTKVEPSCSALDDQWRSQHCATVAGGVAHIFELLNESEARAVIVAAEKHARKASGWTEQRHSRFATRDLPVSLITDIGPWAFNIAYHKVLPAIALLFDVPIEALSVADMFVVKYSMQGQRALAMHEDGSDFSFNVSLSPENSFTGGGTFFEATGEAVIPRCGEVIVHRGSERHCGVAIEGGTRFILVGFVNQKGSTAGQQLRMPVAR